MGNKILFSVPLVHSLIKRRAAGWPVLHLLLLLLLLLCSFSFAAAPLAGSTINNRATATYFDTDSGFSATLYSNTVLVTVSPVEAVQLRAAQTFSRLPGSIVSIPYRVTNTGNTKSSYALTYANGTGDNFDLSNLSLYQDSNGNGVVDPGEQLVVQGAVIVLQPGQSLDFVAQGIVGGNVLMGQTAIVKFAATSQAQGAIADVKDTVVTAASASIQLEKSVSKLSTVPSAVLTYTLTAYNSGSSAATGTATMVDGIPASLLILRDVIPANTTFYSLGASNVGMQLYHRNGDPVNSYTTNMPADVAQVDAVGFGFAQVDPGQSILRTFEVKVNANASGDILNHASIVFSGGVSSLITADSNTTKTTVPLAPPTITYFRDSAYTQVTNVAHTDQVVYVQVDAAQCNADPTRVETKNIIVTSAITGDIETFIARETGINTGIFRITPSVALTGSSAVAGNSIVSTAKNDTLSSSLVGCGANEVHVNLLIDPFGVVYDGRTNSAVSGASVSLLDALTGALATVFQADGVTPAPSTVMTGPTGQYEFPTVAPGKYKLLVLPPGGYSFPSVLLPSVLPAARLTDVLGSYGGVFEVSLATGPVHIDIPLDASNLGGLFIEKAASRTTVELGEFVDYTVKLKNSSGQLLGQVELDDDLPAGFAYVRGSARLNSGTTRLNGSKLPEPEGGVGPKLIFRVGSLADMAVATLTYRVRVGPGALQGDGVNRAQAFSARTATSLISKVSNISTAVVQILPGVFSDRGFIVGRVFADCNRDRLQNAGERGVPDVRLYMEDGTFVITDKEGKFSFYNVRAQTHVLKVDSTTLPPDVQLEILDSRNAGDANSRFVDLKNGELLKVNFAIDGCSSSLNDDIDRRANRERGASETESSALTKITADGVMSPVDVKLLPASGVVGAKQALAAGAQRSLQALPRSAGSAERIDLDKVLPSLSAELQILKPLQHETFGVGQTDVVVKGAAGSVFSLQVNGVEISENRVGRKSVLDSTGVQAWEYIGVDLKPGPNRIELRQSDAFGNERAKTAIDVTAAGKFSKIGVSVSAASVPADGKTLTDITVVVTDAQGFPVKGRTAVTLESSAGIWQAEDLNKNEPGLQLFVEGGQAVVQLLSPTEPGDGEIRASSGDIKSYAALKFLPELRPLIAVGVVEGTLNFKSLNMKALQPVRAQDGFEQELRHFSRTSADGRRDAGARAALFLKGKLKGDYLLTMAYDSEKAAKERLFRDIQPDEFYPVYGDDSVKGFDAQSTGLLYVRVDNGASYLLYGDYSTQSPALLSAAPVRQLSQYSRSLNGARAHAEDERGSINAFAARTSSRSFTEELAALGVSGYYALARTNIVPNSEKVEIITRDRNQPALIIATVPMSRFSDYEIEPLTGRLLFRAPVPSLDAAFNQNFVRITYEYEQGGAQYWVYGVDGQTKVGDRLELGGVYVRDENPLENFTMTGISAAVKLAEKTILSAETAQTKNVLSGSGWGARVEVKHDGDDLQAQVFSGKTTLGFDNPSALLNKGRAESGLKAKLKLNELTSLKAEAIRSEDALNRGVREGALVILERNLADNLNGEFGVRRAKESAVAAVGAAALLAPVDVTAAHFKLSGQLPETPAVSLFGEYEQDVAKSDKKMVAVGGEYRVSDQTKVYLRHELISSLGNSYTLNSTQQRNATVLGVDTGYMKDGHLVSEYRLRDALTGREAEAAIGLRHQWTVSDGVRLQAGFEQIRTVSGADHRSVAVTGGLEYTADPDWKGSTRLEYRTDPASHQVLSTVGVAVKVSKDWTALARNALQVQNGQTGDWRRLDRLQLGLAYRDSITNQWDALMRYEYKADESRLSGVASERQAHVVSTHLAHQASADLNVSGRYAGKYVLDDSGGINSHYTAHLLSARADYDMLKNWTLGASASQLFSGDFRSRQSAFGAEVGRILKKNLWLSVGYNLFGFRDDDLAGEAYTSKGVFLRLRYKFDESAF